MGTGALAMGTYWNGDGDNQAAYDRLHGELVPDSGPAETLEGEMLRAASRLGHEAWNNGFGNNVSGALILLRNHLDGFDAGFWTDIGPYVSGDGPSPVGDRVQMRCEALLDAVVRHVEARGAERAPSPGDHWDMNVERTGLEEPWPEDEEGFWDRDDQEDDEDEDDEPGFRP